MEIPKIIRQKDVPETAKLNTYFFNFEGRTKGAIGIFERFNAEVQAESLEAANLALYQFYDHLHRLSCRSGWTHDKQSLPSAQCQTAYDKAYALELARLMQDHNIDEEEAEKHMPIAFRGY